MYSGIDEFEEVLSVPTTGGSKNTALLVDRLSKFGVSHVAEYGASSCVWVQKRNIRCRNQNSALGLTQFFNAEGKKDELRRFCRLWAHGQKAEFLASVNAREDSPSVLEIVESHETMRI